MMATMRAATRKKTPPTWALLDQKPPLLSGADVTMVVAEGGGAVGVMVRVMTWPVTVMTDSHGVADHVLLGGGAVTGVVVGATGIIDVVGVVDVVGGAIVVRMDDVVGGSGIIDTGFMVDVGIVLVLVDVVEGV